MTMQYVVSIVKMMKDKQMVVMNMVVEVVGLWLGMSMMVHIAMRMMIL